MMTLTNRDFSTTARRVAPAVALAVLLVAANASAFGGDRGDTCSSHSHCDTGSGLYCYAGSTPVDFRNPGHGICRDHDGPCPPSYEPVCDAFGRRYDNTCWASEAGVNATFSCSHVPTVPVPHPPPPHPQPAPPQPQTHPWVFSIVGSVASVDETDLDEFRFYKGTARLRPGVNGTTLYRLPVDCGPRGVAYLEEAWFRFKDDGSHAQVYATLDEYGLGSGGYTNLFEFDSNRRAASSSFQSASVPMSRPQPLDCRHNAYLLSVYVASDGQGDPAFGIARLMGTTDD